MESASLIGPSRTTVFERPSAEAWGRLEREFGGKLASQSKLTPAVSG